jgi:hypothetical protein
MAWIDLHSILHAWQASAPCGRGGPIARSYSGPGSPKLFRIHRSATSNGPALAFVARQQNGNAGQSNYCNEEILEKMPAFFFHTSIGNNGAT